MKRGGSFRAGSSGLLLSTWPKIVYCIALLRIISMIWSCSVEKIALWLYCIVLCRKASGFQVHKYLTNGATFGAILDKGALICFRSLSVWDVDWLFEHYSHTGEQCPTLVQFGIPNLKFGGVNWPCFYLVCNLQCWLTNSPKNYESETDCRKLIWREFGVMNRNTMWRDLVENLSPSFRNCSAAISLLALLCQLALQSQNELQKESMKKNLDFTTIELTNGSSVRSTATPDPMFKLHRLGLWGASH